MLYDQAHTAVINTVCERLHELLLQRMQQQSFHCGAYTEHCDQ
jgi:hypothetical protein